MGLQYQVESVMAELRRIENRYNGYSKYVTSFASIGGRFGYGYVNFSEWTSSTSKNVSRQWQLAWKSSCPAQATQSR